MAKIKRPFGITFIAILMTVSGGIMTLITLIEIFDSIRFLGFDGISVVTPISFFGFLVFGLVPLFFYLAGMGLFLLRRWAYIFMLKFFPGLCFILFFIITINIVRQRFSYHHFNVLFMFFSRPQFFLWMMFWYVIIVWPVRLYFKIPYIESYFIEEKSQY